MIELRIAIDGLITMLYAEGLPIRKIGSIRITRASHVEPDDSGDWWADLQPSHGPRLGPFPSRSQALAEERVWLTEQLLFGNQTSPPEAEELSCASTKRFETPTVPVCQEGGSDQAAFSCSELS